LEVKYGVRHLSERFTEEWEREEQVRKHTGGDPTPSLWRVLGRLHWMTLAVSGALLLGNYAAVWLLSILIEMFVTFIAEPQPKDMWYGCVLVVGFFCCSLMQTACWHHYSALCEIVGMSVSISVFQ